MLVSQDHPVGGRDPGRRTCRSAGVATPCVPTCAGRSFAAWASAGGATRTSSSGSSPHQARMSAGNRASLGVCSGSGTRPGGRAGVPGGGGRCNPGRQRHGRCPRAGAASRRCDRRWIGVQSAGAVRPGPPPRVAVLMVRGTGGRRRSLSRHGFRRLLPHRSPAVRPGPIRDGLGQVRGRWHGSRYRAEPPYLPERTRTGR